MASKNSDIDTGNFAELFESSMTQMSKLKPGDTLETTIISISDECIFLQLSGKSEGIISRGELTDKDGNLTVKEGDTIKAFFLGDKKGEMTFTTKISSDKADAGLLENAFKNSIPVEGIVEKEIKGGFEVKIGGTRAFCPFSQMGEKRVEDTKVYLGKTFTFKIQEFKEGGRNIVVSNRAVAEEVRNIQMEGLKKTLHEGQIVTGKIKSLQDFGAFVDVNGIQALLPISEIARSRVEDISAVLTVGQEIEAKILRIDWAKERISVSLKALLEDPWDSAEEKYPAGSILAGKVVRLTGFGAFVNLESGIDGLVHISEFKGEDKHGNQVMTAKVGDTLRVQVIEVDGKKKRISLKLPLGVEEEETRKKYLENGADSDNDTYNPFSALLKKK